MNMTKTFKKVGVLAIVLLMIAALVGCGGNQEEKQWEEDVTAIMNDITLSQTDFNTALAGILAITVHSTGDFTMNGTQYDVGFGGMHGQQLYQDLAAFLEEFA